jgi:hypothetical protein
MSSSSVRITLTTSDMLAGLVWARGVTRTGSFGPNPFALLLLAFLTAWTFSSHTLLSGRWCLPRSIFSRALFRNNCTGGVGGKGLSGGGVWGVDTGLWLLARTPSVSIEGVLSLFTVGGGVVARPSRAAREGLRVHSGPVLLADSIRATTRTCAPLHENEYGNPSRDVMSSLLCTISIAFATDRLSDGPTVYLTSWLKERLNVHGRHVCSEHFLFGHNHAPRFHAKGLVN